MARAHSRILTASLVAALFGVPAGCHRDDDQLETADVLELHVGGNYEPLSQALRRPPPGVPDKPVSRRPAGSQPVDPQHAIPQPVDSPVDSQPVDSQPVKPLPVKPLPVQPLPVKPQPVKPLPVKPQPVFRTVVLQAGQTLYGLCRSELGDGGRWKEVAGLNGWSESQAGSLREGQAVRLPVDGR